MSLEGVPPAETVWRDIDAAGLGTVEAYAKLRREGRRRADFVTDREVYSEVKM
jgi:hypothetical protein